jgi:hypothetical protein
MSIQSFTNGGTDIDLIKGTVAQDFLLQVFFMNHLAQSP